MGQCFQCGKKISNDFGFCEDCEPPHATPEADNTRIVVLCSAVNAFEAHELCNVLCDAGIQAEVVGEGLANMAGGGLPVGEAISPRIWVREDDLARACEILRQRQDTPQDESGAWREDDEDQESESGDKEEGPLPSDVRFGFLSQGFGIAGLICMVVGSVWAWQNGTTLSQYSATTIGRRVHYVSYAYTVDQTDYTASAPASNHDSYPDAIIIHYDPRSPAQCIAGTIAPVWVVLTIGFGVGIFSMFVAYQFRYPSA